MGRVRTGIRLAGQSWRIVRTERSLLAFPLLSALFAVGYLAIVIAPLGVVGYVVLGDNPILQLVLLFLMLLGMSIGATFFGVATAANASAVFDGRDPTLGDGIRVARSRLGVIVKWSIVSATVGAVLQLIGERGGIGGALIQVVGGVAWTIASFFALPILALEGLGPIATLKQSVAVVRKKWGESLVGGVAIGFVTGLIMLAAIGVIVLGVLLGANATWVGGVPVIAIGAVVLVAAATVGAVLRAVFTVAVYRYATEGAALGGFAAEDLDRAFRPKRGRI
jgi:hypothetical protein